MLLDISGQTRHETRRGAVAIYFVGFRISFVYNLPFRLTSVLLHCAQTIS